MTTKELDDKIIHNESRKEKVMREGLEKLKVPTPPSIDRLSDSEAKAVVTQYVEELEFVTLENQQRFEKAFRRMKWCMWLHSLMNPFGGIKYIHTHHFNWCPHYSWFADWKPWAEE